MAKSSSIAAQEKLLLELKEALCADQQNVNLLCQLGRTAYQMGQIAAADTTLDRCVRILKQLAARGDASTAIAVEALIYANFVKLIESEHHYHACFKLWVDDIEKLALQYRNRNASIKAGFNGKIAFILPTGSLLGHTEVLFRMLSAGPNYPVRLYVIDAYSREFYEEAQRQGVELVCHPLGEKATLMDKLIWLRARLEADQIQCIVWTSVPALATFVFPMRIAPVQIFWALRFHPLRLNDIDGYITYGAWTESTREYWGQTWEVCPVPLALQTRPIDSIAIDSIRAQFPQRFLFGTLAREEKIDSRPFLEAVAQILKRNSHAGFLWTGREYHAGIGDFFKQHGVLKQCHFIGWVDSQLYAASLDVFLETFPLGCGITGYQAMARGVPVLSYLSPDTVFGMQYYSDVMSKSKDLVQVSDEILKSYPLLCARDSSEYVDLATRMCQDEIYRREQGENCSQFFEAEVANTARYTARFFDTVAKIANEKLGEASDSRSPVASS